MLNGCFVLDLLMKREMRGNEHKGGRKRQNVGGGLINRTLSTDEPCLARQLEDGKLVRQQQPYRSPCRIRSAEGARTAFRFGTGVSVTSERAIPYWEHVSSVSTQPGNMWTALAIKFSTR